MPDPQLFNDASDDDGRGLSGAAPDTPSLTGGPVNIDPPDPANSNLDGGQVLYHMALGAQPDAFHPALQPMARGYAIALQPQPDMGPGLLGSAEDIRAAAVQTPAAVDDGNNDESDESAADRDVADQGDSQNSDDENDGEQDDGEQDDDGQPAASSTPDPVQRLKDAQNDAMANKRFAPNPKTKQTHCNEATYAIAGKTGADVTPLEKSPGVAADANTQTRQLGAAANKPGSGWTKIDRGEAQSYANQGKTVVLGWADPAGGHGHTVTVRPNAVGVASNPTLAQIGGPYPGNGEHTFRQSFGKEKQDAVGAYAYVGQ